MQESIGTETYIEKAAVFVDYANLHDAIVERTTQPADAHDAIVELINALREKSDQESRTTIVSASAYADFSEFVDQAGSVQQLLYLHGIEPRFVSRAIQSTSTEIQLSADAVDLLHSRPDIETFIFVSGDRPYLPLVHAVQRKGRDVQLVLFEEGQLGELLPSLRSAVFDASDFLPKISRRGPANADTRALLDVSASNGHNNTSTEDVRIAKEHRRVANALCLEALQLIDDFFGQYDEIYLTPLLRKMSEELGTETSDPKALISELEEAGAVWLEKRRGFPYDYTVLLVDDQHPDVQQIQRKSQVAGRNASGADYSYDSSVGGGLYD